MIETLTATEPTARKNYYCEACEWLKSNGNLRYFTFTFSEWRAIITARENGWEIKKGEKYIYQRNKYEGNLYTFRAIPKIHDICIKYDYYEL